MTDQAPVSSRHVRVMLLKQADVPVHMIEKLEIFTEITRDDQAKTTVQTPPTQLREEWYHWHHEVLRALRELDGAEQGISFAGVSQTFEVTWHGVCRPT